MESTQTIYMLRTVHTFPVAPAALRAVLSGVLEQVFSHPIDDWMNGMTLRPD